MDFINRSSGTILETEYELLVNLFLVKKGGRKVCLVECCGLSLKNGSIGYKGYFELIKKTYPEFVYKVNDYGYNFQEQNDLYYATFFVSLSEIPKYQSEIENYEKYLGKVLGFNEHGIPDPKKIRYSLGYSVIIEEQSKYEFYCEIVSSKSIINSKREKFNDILKELDWRVEEDIEELLPFNIWIESVIKRGEYDGNKNWLYENEVKFKEELCGYGWTLFDNLSLEVIMEKYYRWLLFIVLACEIDPFEILYPIHSEESEFLLDFQKEIFEKYNDKPPIILIDKMVEIDFIKLKLESNKKFKDFYIKKRNELINRFDYCII